MNEGLVKTTELFLATDSELLWNLTLEMALKRKKVIGLSVFYGNSSNIKHLS